MRELRRTPRYAFQVNLLVNAMPRDLQVVTDNISENGVFIATEALRAPNQLIKFTVVDPRDPSGQSRFELMGIVVWRAGQSAANRAGMGVSLFGNNREVELKWRGLVRQVKAWSGQGRVTAPNAAPTAEGEKPASGPQAPVGRNTTGTHRPIGATGGHRPIGRATGGHTPLGRATGSHTPINRGTGAFPPVGGHSTGPHRPVGSTSGRHAPVPPPLPDDAAVIRPAAPLAPRGVRPTPPPGVQTADRLSGPYDPISAGHHPVTGGHRPPVTGGHPPVPPQDSPTGRAHHRRSAAHFNVTLRPQGLAELEAFRVKDISEGGTFVLTASLVPVGSRVTVRLIHPSTRETWNIPGQVVRTIDSLDPGEKGLGIRFDLEAVKLDAWDDFIGRNAPSVDPTAIDTQHQPATPPPLPPQAPSVQHRAAPPSVGGYGQD